MANEIIQLDLAKNVLLGYQTAVYDTILFSIYQGIQRHQMIRPVPVAYKDGRYTLIFTPDPDFCAQRFEDGGHHRAYAHYILGVPLPAIVFPKKYALPFGVTMNAMDVQEDIDNRAYQFGLRVGKKYQPLDGFQRPLNLEKLTEELRSQMNFH